jgi:sterol 14-demethylase
VTYHFGDHHLDPTLFHDPYTWDPSRFQGPQAEDKKTQNAFIGWGTGRHPCLGMRFAKLEQNIITAYFLTMFDFELCDTEGNKIEKLPDHWENHNNWQASKPDQPVRLRYWLREDGGL